MPFTITRNDITKMQVDAIVNAANTDLMAGGGVCGAIFTAAGVEKLQKACDSLAPIQTGEAVITKGYALPARYVIHTAGPVYRGGKHNEETLLRACYLNSLNTAKKHKCESIAFPLISSGIYGYPKDEALAVATSAIREWLMENDMDVSLVVFDKAAFELSRELLGEVKTFVTENYVDEHYVDEASMRFGRHRQRPWAERELHEASDMSASLFQRSYGEPQNIAESLDCAVAEKNLDDLVGRLDEPFSLTLLRLIDAKGKTDVDVYKHANLDRKLFSKIRTGKGYTPSKKTAVALAIALELSLPETHDLLKRAGYALSRSVVFDVIIEYFITSKRYDVFEINNVLFEYDQPLLGG